MALLEILHYPDSRLRQKALPVKKVDDALRFLIKDMFETMYHAPGVGLAATQVNVQLQLAVIDISRAGTAPICLINPQVVAKNGVCDSQEGCLSVPEIFDTIERADRIHIKALNEKGEPIQLEADGLLAICIQHELDHLNGKLFIDHLSSLKRQRIQKQFKK